MEWHNICFSLSLRFCYFLNCSSSIVHGICFCMIECGLVAHAMSTMMSRFIIIARWFPMCKVRLARTPSKNTYSGPESNCRRIRENVSMRMCTHRIRSAKGKYGMYAVQSGHWPSCVSVQASMSIQKKARCVRKWNGSDGVRCGGLIPLWVACWLHAKCRTHTLYSYIIEVHDLTINIVFHLQIQTHNVLHVLYDFDDYVTMAKFTYVPPAVSTSVA